MSEYLTPRAIKSRLKLDKAVIDEDGFLDVKCSHCSEELPHTTEFFHKMGEWGLDSRCKVCIKEIKTVKIIYSCSFSGICDNKEEGFICGAHGNKKCSHKSILTS